VRRWVTFEARGIESHPDLRLSTDADLARLLPSIATSADQGSAETRARVMLELSRTSEHAMLEASTTRIYTTSTSPVEDLVAGWFSAMRENVDVALTPPVPAARPVGYVRPTSDGMQPWLDRQELTGVVGALAVDTGMGLRAKDAGAAYDRLVDRELDAARRSATSGGDVRRDVARLGFLDQSASAALVAVARRQDELNRSAWRGLAEAGHVVAEIRRGGVTGLASTVHTYVDGGTMRTPTDDLLIALVRSNVELSQTDLDDQRRGRLVRRIEAITGKGTDVLPTIALGTRHAPQLPTATELRAVRDAEIRAAFDAAFEDGARGRGASALDRLQQQTAPTDRVHVAPRTPPRGSVDETRVPKVASHERRTAERLARAGHHVVFLPTRNHTKNADALIDGDLWELKGVKGNGRNTVVDLLRHGRKQSPRMVVDLAHTELSLDEVLRQVDYTLRRYDGITAIRVITKDERIIERSP
jgi:hypothetical protein